jgi:hypothetical protein
MEKEILGKRAPKRFILSGQCFADGQRPHARDL